MSRREFEDAMMDGQLVFDNGTLKPITHMKEYRRKQYADLEKKLNDPDNEEHIALLTIEEAVAFLKSMVCKDGTHKEWKDKVFACTDPASSFAGNVVDALGLAKIINEFRSFRVQAKEYKLKGVSYIKITGKRTVKSIITGSRYRINDHRILKIGIGSKNVVNGIVSGAKICIYFSLAYRAIEFMTKDEYSLADFIGNITVDTAKLIISALLTAAIGKAASTYLFAAGASIIGVSAGLFFLGVVIAVALFYIDKELGISEKVIEAIREADEKIPGDYYEINRQGMALSSPAIWPWN